MGFSWEDDMGDDDKREDVILPRDETKGGMEFGCNGLVEFWPVEHPSEPSDEDHPVKCPMPDSSSLLHERFSNTMRKRTELSAEINQERRKAAAAEPPPPLPPRAVRKRHHASSPTTTHWDHTLSPLTRMPPFYPPPVQNMTIFQMLQNFDNFEH